ncbi:MAG: glycosyltransferase family 39 protein [Patescibacteria group bacterium]
MVQAWLAVIFGLRPFIGHHDWNGVFYSQISRNFLDYGYWFTRLGQMTSPGNFYTHYPPLFTWLLSFWFRVFGVSDINARLMTLLFYLAAIFLLYKICLVLKLKSTAALAACLVIFTPMFRYFSRMPSQEALILFFTLLSLYFFLTKNNRMFYFSVVANGLSGWAGYFFYPLLWFYDRRLALKASLILVLIFCLHLAHVYWLTGSIFGGGILDALLLRLGLFPQLGLVEPELPGQFTWGIYLIKEARILIIYYTLILIFLAAVSFIWIRTKITLILLVWGLAYPLIFSNVVFVHEYFNLYLLPFFSLSLAYLFNRFNLKPILILALALLIYWERNQFYQALIVTRAFEPGVKLGREINQTTPKGITATVTNTKEFISSQNLFIEFYADREIEYIELK